MRRKPPKGDLVMYWGTCRGATPKDEPDFVFNATECRNDCRALYGIMTDAFLADLESRGYDTHTIFFRVDLRPEVKADCRKRKEEYARERAEMDRLRAEFKVLRPDLHNCYGYPDKQPDWGIAFRAFCESRKQENKDAT